MKKSILFVTFFAVVVMASLIVAGTNQTENNSTSTNITYGDGNNITLNDTENNITTDNETRIIKNRSLNWNNRCQAVNHRVGGIINHYEEGKFVHFRSFSHMVEVLKNIINKTDEKGYNVTELQNDLITLNDKILKFQQDYAVFVQKLNNTRNYTCGHSEGQFQAALNDSKAQLKILRQDAEDIKNFFDSVVKEDFGKLKQQRKDDADRRRMDKENERFNETRGDFGNRTGGNRNISEEDRGRFQNRTPGQGFNRSGDDFNRRNNTPGFGEGRR